jgi:mannose-6-phosphate isomerase-like protein (cupin superfamily)
MAYVLTAQSTPAFKLRGLTGYQFQPIRNSQLDIHLLDVHGGHDTFVVSKTLTRVYYVTTGFGYFVIDGRKYDVWPGVLVEVPPGIEYSYSGTMRLLLISNPRWFPGNESITRENPDVIRKPGR